MALINWSNNYSVNIKDIDDQHVKLVNLINDLHSSMKVGKGGESLQRVVSELVSYTKYHFSFEEKLMSRHNYPDISQHKILHSNFTKKVDEFENELKNGNSFISQEVIMFLKSWLINHIKGTDKSYSTFFNKAGVK